MGNTMQGEMWKMFWKVYKFCNSGTISLLQNHMKTVSLKNIELSFAGNNITVDVNYLSIKPALDS